MIASTLLTVVLAGPILRLLGAHSATSQLGLLATLTLVVALPLLAGCAMRTIDPFGGRERPLIDVAGTASLLVLLWEIASELRLHASDALVAVALLVYLAGAGLLGWLLTLGVSSSRRSAVILPTAMRDFAVAAGIAASAFGIAAAAPLGIYGVMVLVFGAIVVNTSRRG
jgi:ACR3 family arsenite efflux pump ArsB